MKTEWDDPPHDRLRRSRRKRGLGPAVLLALVLLISTGYLIKHYGSITCVTAFG